MLCKQCRLQLSCWSRRLGLITKMTAALCNHCGRLMCRIKEKDHWNSLDLVPDTDDTLNDYLMFFCEERGPDVLEVLETYEAQPIRDLAEVYVDKLGNDLTLTTCPYCKRWSYWEMAEDLDTGERDHANMFRYKKTKGA